MDGSNEEIVALFGVMGIGLALGQVAWRGISLGTSGVVFVALIAGHFGFQVPKVAGSVGVVLFVYCLGIGTGPSFLRTFFQQGKQLAVMAVAMILAGGFVAWLAASLLHLSPGLASGLFSGAMTSTPALAAAAEQLPSDPEVAVGFGIAYPFGVIGVILFVQFMPRYSAGLPTTSSQSTEGGDQPISRMMIHVMNPGVVGKRLRDIAAISHANCQVSRLLVDGKLKPIPASFCLAPGQQVLVVGARRHIREVAEVLGEPCEDVDYVLDLERQHRRVVVNSKEMIGQTLAELHLLSRYGVTISRITRQDIEFVPNPQERIQYGDALTAVGELQGLDQFVRFAGHRERTLDETDLISLAAGLVLGIVVGSLKLTLGSKSISLGLAGGPLLVGLILGHLGRIGPIVPRMPRAARFLLSEIGLALFLAQAGSQAGSEFVAVIQEHGIALPLAAIAIVTVPLLVGLLVARFLFGLGLWEMCGGMCGAMTSTPGLGAVTSSVDSSVPATSYAAVYPLALILITILAPVLIAQLS